VSGTGRLAEAERLLSLRRPAEALALLEAHLHDEPGHAAGWCARGRALNNLGRLEEASAAFFRALDIDPASADAWASLGHVLARRGRTSDAVEAWQRALAADPGQARALAGMGAAASAAGRRDEAADWLCRAAEAEPDNADHWINLAQVLQFLERAAEAERAWRRAAAAPGAPAVAWAGLGRLLHGLGRVGDAIPAYREAIAADAADAESRAALALCLEVSGRIEAATAVLAPWAGRPTHPAIEHAAGRLLAAAGRSGEAVQRIRRSLDEGDAAWRRLPLAWFSLGDALDATGDHLGAFDAWERANSLKPVTFSPEAFRARLAALMQWFSAERVAGWPPAAAAPLRPVFIVGMPRSGTTLVEQVLACHPAVQPGGERLELDASAAARHAAGRPPAPEDDAEAAALRARWLAGCAAPGVPAARCTDKFPGNLLHLGLVRRLFPEALTVWCRRDPADTAVSIYAHDFNRRIVPWATKLEHIALVHAAQERLMTHWRAVLGLPVLELRYETLLADFEAGVRRLLAFLELPWHEGCLRFHESSRLANTASYAQVRRPLYTTSIGRHARYGARLEPFLRALDAERSR